MSKPSDRTDEAPRLTRWVPDLLYAGGRFRRGRALLCDARGLVRAVERDDGSGRFVADVEAQSSVASINQRDDARDLLSSAVRTVRLPGRALLPGMVNAHSHAFQRVIRGRTEFRTAALDSFWTWREMMYSAAVRLTPEDIYDASRMAFLEMLLGGITSVGEFHYLHRTPDGSLYDDPNLLAKQVVRAARDTGLRIALLRVAYARSGHDQPPNPRQSRFIEPEPETYLRHLEQLHDDLEAHGRANDADESGTLRGAWVGVAPHSVRAVPLGYLRDVCAFAGARRLPVHMHVAEQTAEVEACLAEHGRAPVELLAHEGLLHERFTAVHAVHVNADEARALGASGSTVCACPTTERNLGDGVVPADLLLSSGVHVALGSDSHTQIDLLEDARELEYHLRLQRQARNVLAPATEGERKLSALAARLFACTTSDGARSIGLLEFDGPADVNSRTPAASVASDAREMFAPGRPADFFTVDLNDPSIAGASEEDLLPALVFSLARTAVRETVVGNRLVLEDGRHASSGEIITRFNALQRKLWGKE
ncbi:MAG TPA: formimidoylglutamate deiminase [Pyrinomonadaceae bacterium]|nr:formimidoylglutamate deiminase [Pyrinomonadaceae bacterium]